MHEHSAPETIGGTHKSLILFVWGQKMHHDLPEFLCRGGVASKKGETFEKKSKFK